VLAKWAVTGAGAIGGGVAGAAGGAVGADVVDQVVEELKQDSSHIVTRETSDLKEEGWKDANDLLAQSLWKHEMWNTDVQSPPIVPGSDKLEDPQRIINSDGHMPRNYEEWVEKYNPYDVNQQTIHNTYNTGAEKYADATGNRPVPACETK